LLGPAPLNRRFGGFWSRGGKPDSANDPAAAIRKLVQPSHTLRRLALFRRLTLTIHTGRQLRLPKILQCRLANARTGGTESVVLRHHSRPALIASVPWMTSTLDMPASAQSRSWTEHELAAPLTFDSDLVPLAGRRFLAAFRPPAHTGHGTRLRLLSASPVASPHRAVFELLTLDLTCRPSRRAPQIRHG
jgi:hypothetical protein